MIGGFGEAGSPYRADPRAHRPGRVRSDRHQQQHRQREVGLAALLKARRVTKVICSFPKTANSTVFPELYREGFTELELVPQGTLAERIRAGGAGVHAFYTPTAVGTPLAEGKESRVFDGREYLLEFGLTADFALIKGRTADTHGNVLYNKTARNFAPIMAMAATTTIVQARSVVEPGGHRPGNGRHPRDLRRSRRRGRRAGARVESLIAAGVSYP
jgi:3-oxoadipate CoA-transferase alpha subunit